MDNPVGTGFSLSSTDDDVPKDQETAARHLDYALSHFVRRNPVFRLRPLFLAGESYAGKYIPSLAYHIMCQPSPLKSQLVGIAIGNGLVDPCSQVSFIFKNEYIMRNFEISICFIYLLWQPRLSIMWG